MFEFLLVVFENLKTSLCVVIIIYGLSIIFFTMIIDVFELEVGSANRALRLIKNVGIVIVCLLPSFLIPSSKQLWEARINLIKFNLASKENITQTTETIERIGKKLECKYLKCEDGGKNDYSK